MCLDLTIDAKSQIATKDIICYKRILIDHASIIRQCAGKSFTGIIKGIECEGKIQVEKDKIYFCTNNKFLDGMNCNNKLGYKYSYTFDSHVKKIMVDGVDLMISTKDAIFTTPYRGATVKLGETYTSELIRRRNDTIEIGLHSFGNYEDARNDGSGTIVKCIIPKGAEYYEGEFYGKKSYASNQLKYIEIVTE